LTLAWSPIVTLSGVIPNCGGPSKIKKMENKNNKDNAKHGISSRLKMDPVTLTYNLENE
jgi:hypothetical protein